jgi:pseudouridylate synthase
MSPLDALPIRVADEVAQALSEGRGVVALETTLIVHGLPSPDNLVVAKELEDVIRSHGAVPATIGMLGGTAVIGLGTHELARLADSPEPVAKLSSRDLGLAAARHADGATTVAGTITIAALAGISVMATGGLGGVHRGAQHSYDESADLSTMSRVPVLVVAAGVKSILDVPATLERLETLGVPVAGYRTEQFPGFYIAATEHRLDWSLESPDEAARAFAAHLRLRTGGMLLANPLAEDEQLDPAVHDSLLAEGLRLLDEQQIGGKAATPFLLSHLAGATGGESVRVNRTIVLHNAALAAQVAVSLAALDAPA